MLAAQIEIPTLALIYLVTIAAKPHQHGLHRRLHRPSQNLGDTVTFLANTKAQTAMVSQLFLAGLARLQLASV